MLAQDADTSLLVNLPSRAKLLRRGAMARVPWLAPKLSRALRAIVASGSGSCTTSWLHYHARSVGVPSGSLAPDALVLGRSHPWCRCRASTADAARGRACEVDTSMPEWREEALNVVTMLMGAGRRASARRLAVAMLSLRRMFVVAHFFITRGRFSRVQSCETRRERHHTSGHICREMCQSVVHVPLHVVAIDAHSVNMKSC